MKNIFIATLLTVILLLTSSCSTKKKYSMRKLEDVNNAGAKIKKNPNDLKTIQKLLDAAEYGNRSVKAEALWVLANARSMLAYGLFLRYSTDDPDFNVRIMALYGMRMTGYKNDTALEKVRVAINDTALQVQIEALKTAAALNDDILIKPILGSLSSKNKWVRMEAVNSLKNYKSDIVNVSLKQLQRTETDLGVKYIIEQTITYRQNEALM